MSVDVIDYLLWMFAAKGKKLVSIADALEMQQSNLPVSSDEDEELDVQLTSENDKSTSTRVEGEDESTLNQRQRRVMGGGAVKAMRTKVV